MMQLELPDGRHLRRRLALVDAAVAVPSVVVVIVYLVALVDLEPGEWRRFALAGAIVSAIVGAGFEPLRRRLQAPLWRYLDAVGRGEVPPRPELHTAFATSIALPRSTMIAMAVAWGVAVPLLPVVAWLCGEPGWFAAARFLVLAVAVSTGGLCCSGFLFLTTKRVLAPCRAGLAARMPDPAERSALVRRVPLAHKLRFAIVGTSVASLVFSMGMAYSRAAAGVERMAIDWHRSALAALVEPVEAEGLGAARAAVFPDPRLVPHDTHFAVLEPGAVDEEDPRWQQILDRIAAGETEGLVNRSDDALTQTWVALSDGRALVAFAPRDQLHAALGGSAVLMGIVLVLATGLALAVAHLLAVDVRQATEALTGEAERMALGDLRRGRSLESEDELGDLSRSFERMGGALRATVGRVAEAADRLDGAAGEISSLAQGVGAASADQVRRIQQATELMNAIKGQVEGVAQSAQALNVSVEESSSSILELGAAGDELNETASVLSGRVEEVSSSIDQMVRSVKQVGTHTESLSEIAGETSSSMEEMASAMRVVDNTAGKTATLSSSMVESSEKGQAKVSQTIEGMEAIRDATDSAERVIRGLGERTKEIGAILDVIDDVADETNLLALNAAIIAAQAGEHGRAFSVVADEIKELADRVLASTKEISGLISSVQGESHNAVGAIEEGARSVASGVQLSAEAGISLEEITRSSRESGTRIGEIVSAVREQTKAAGHVAELMERVRSGVDQIRAAGEEQDRGNEVVHRSSVTMREVAQQVRRTTEEQARGFGRIRESVEGVRLAVEHINSSLQEQSNACNQVAGFLDQVFERTRSNEEAGQRMGEAMRGLLSQAESLREDVAKFQI